MNNNCTGLLYNQCSHIATGLQTCGDNIVLAFWGQSIFCVCC